VIPVKASEGFAEVGDKAGTCKSTGEPPGKQTTTVNPPAGRAKRSAKKEKQRHQRKPLENKKKKGKGAW